MNESEKKLKIDEYQKFIDETLKVDLKEIETNLRKKFDKFKEWEELKDIVRMLKMKQDQDVNLQVPIGCNVYVNAETETNDTVLVDVGLGCLLEMNYIETDKYCNIRMGLLKKEIEHYRSFAVNVKVKIKLTLLAINELKST